MLLQSMVVPFSRVFATIIVQVLYVVVHVRSVELLTHQAISLTLTWVSRHLWVV